MSNQIIPFDQGGLPAYLSAGTKLGNIISTGGGGFPVISIKGKVFHIRRGDTTTLISQADDADLPAPYIDVVILNTNPGLAKIYYDTNYSEGSDQKPLCYSNDGEAPAKDAQEPQAKKCATCTHNQWGSRITEGGAKAKECQDSKRLAVATPNAVNDAMLLRVPAASLKGLGQYIKLLESRGVDNYQAVVTRIGFDYSVAHPALTFKPIGFVDEATFAQVVEAVGSELVGQIIGTVEVAREENPEQVVETPKPRKAAEKPAEAAPAKAAPKAKPAPVEEEDEDEPKPRVKVKVEGDEPQADPVPAKPAPAAKAKPAAAPVVVDDMDDGLDAALDGINWDD